MLGKFIPFVCKCGKYSVTSLVYVTSLVFSFPVQTPGNNVHGLTQLQALLKPLE